MKYDVKVYTRNKVLFTENTDALTLEELQNYLKINGHALLNYIAVITPVKGVI